jgi:glycosyltransferase involved in cell wall biosynthesis
MKTMVLLPARNEEKNIGPVLDRIAHLHPELPVVVVNDCSTDQTASVVQSREHVTLINLPVWLGYGGALQTGYKYALRHGFDAVIQMDSDGQHNPDFLSPLIEALSSADLAVGSRFLGGRLYPMSRTRRLGCYLLSFAGSMAAGMRITDPTSGFQALSRKALMVAVQDQYPLDYPDIDVLILMARNRLRIVELPVEMLAVADRKGMHAGLQVLYYGMKMFLSILVMSLRKAS